MHTYLPWKPRRDSNLHSPVPEADAMLIICGNNGQGSSLIAFIRSRQLDSQVNTNCNLQTDIQNKWADPPKGVEPIRSKWNEDIKHFKWEQKKRQENERRNMLDKIVHYFPQIFPPESSFPTTVIIIRSKKSSELRCELSCHDFFSCTVIGDNIHTRESL
jgi:hypothetical protein